MEDGSFEDIQLGLDSFAALIAKRRVVFLVRFKFVLGDLVK